MIYARFLRATLYILAISSFALWLSAVYQHWQVSSNILFVLLVSLLLIAVDLFIAKKMSSKK